MDPTGRCASFPPPTPPAPLEWEEAAFDHERADISVDLCESLEVSFSGEDTDMISSQKQEDKCIDSIPLLPSSFLCSSCLQGPLLPDKPADTTDKPTNQEWKKRRQLVVHSGIIVFIVFFLLAIVLGIVLLAGKVHHALQTNAAIKPCHRSKNDFPHPPLPGKKGAAYTLRDVGRSGNWVENLPKVIQLNPYWNYSWGPKRIAQQPDHIEFVPMLWGRFRTNVDTGRADIDVILNDILPQVQAGRVKRLLGFNEPDLAQQANMTVESALASWPLLEEINLPLISPSCAHPERDVRNVGFLFFILLARTQTFTNRYSRGNL
jgi:Glycosyl hydrolase catalytic core